MSKETQQETAESKLLNLLLQGLKMPVQKTEVKQPHWVDKHFGIPSNPEDVLWRFCWLVIVPAMATLIYLPLSHWLWQMGQGALMSVTSLAIASCLLFFSYFVLSAADPKLRPLVNLQLFIPWFTVLVVMIWQGVLSYVSQ
jgi:hypothetical protein